MKSDFEEALDDLAPAFKSYVDENKEKRCIIVVASIENDEDDEKVKLSILTYGKTGMLAQSLAGFMNNKNAQPIIKFVRGMEKTPRKTMAVLFFFACILWICALGYMYWTHTISEASLVTNSVLTMWGMYLTVRYLKHGY